MGDFTASVLREKFVLTDIGGQAQPVIALSNRFELNLYDHTGKLVESFIIRGQMLHTVVRFGGAILNAFERTGPILNRQVPVNWEQLWEKSAGGYEYHHNPKLWVTVFHAGKPIFQKAEHHSFFDVIEQCDARHSRSYEDSVKVAEDMFSKAGRPVSITHDSSIANTFTVGSTRGKAGVIMRGAQRTTTFIINGEKRADAASPMTPVHFINTAAAFLEGIQLAFIIGQGNEKQRQNLIGAYSEEGIALQAARTRMGEVNAAINTFENTYEVFYRPERPNFAELVTNAEDMTRTRLEAIEG